ncbi:hypothetical protein HZP84_00425 [Elizabethkingia anophelis]|nr:hypothetical protein [Elizabethkingia anophelis]MCT4078598.1 hypothetical protein [Elizabethkingia anophelis]MCT4090260.1 hypothetical protein [Elizabethkingia anophelis]
MKTRFLLLIIIVLVSFGCNNDENIMKNQNIEGQYLGFFERNGQSAEVQLSLENGLFKGNSNAQKPPAICNGNYSYNKNGNTIIFKNSCFWTAQFDWSLILDETWNYNLKANTLTLLRENGDKYILTKQ